MDDDDFRARFSRRLDDHSDRIKALEIRSAVEEQRHETLISRMDKLDGHMVWLIRVIATAGIGAFVMWIVNGGLKLV